MATTYPALFVDTNGETRIAGTITFTANEPTFNGGTITQPLVVDLSAADGSTVPLTVKASFNSQGVDFVAVVNSDTGHDVVAVDAGANLVVNDRTSGANRGTLASTPGAVPSLLTVTGFGTEVIRSGALPTVAFVSGTPSQVGAAGRDVTLVVPFTGDATNNAATLKIELSPDNTTYSTLDTLSIAAALNLSGALNVPVTVFVPAAWYVNLTATHGTIGTATYY